MNVRAKATEKFKILRVDSDSIEEMSDDAFTFFGDCLFAKFTAMQNKGHYTFMNFDDIRNIWMQYIVDGANEERYKTSYFVMFRKVAGEIEYSLAIVRNSYGLLGLLKGMKLMEFYALGGDYDEMYEHMKKYLLKCYAGKETTIFKPCTYQRLEHMVMGAMESIY